LPGEMPELGTFAVTATLAPPSAAAPLDRLQAEGVATLLHRALSQAREAVGPDGSVITVMDRWVGTHPDGAMLAVVVTGSSAAFAEAAVRALVEHILTTSAPLEGWRLSETEVRVGASARSGR